MRRKRRGRWRLKRGRRKLLGGIKKWGEWEDEGDQGEEEDEKKEKVIRRRRRKA